MSMIEGLMGGACVGNLKYHPLASEKEFRTDLSIEQLEIFEQAFTYITELDWQSYICATSYDVLGYLEWHAKELGVILELVEKMSPPRPKGKQDIQDLIKKADTLRSNIIASRLGLGALTETDQGREFLFLLNKANQLNAVAAFVNYGKDRGTDEIFKSEEGILKTLREGKWEIWTETKNAFNALYRNSPNSKRSGQSQLPHHEWMCISSRGFIYRDRKDNKRLVEVARSTPEEYKMLQDVAHRFDPQSKPNTEAIIQIVATKLKDESHYHFSTRLIDGHTRDRKIYSVQLEQERNEKKTASIWQKMRSYLVSENAHLAVLDRSEFATEGERVITNVPIAGANAKEILDRWYEYKEKNVRYNVLCQNELSLATEAMEIGGYKGLLPQRITLVHYGWRSFASMRIPATLGRAIERVNHFVQSFCVTLLGKWITKECGKLACKVYSVILLPVKILEIIFSVFLNSVVYPFLGARSGIGEAPSYHVRRTHSDKGIRSFNVLIQNKRDMVNPYLVTVQDEGEFVEWMKKQHSTQIITMDGKPRFSILKPEDLGI